MFTHPSHDPHISCTRFVQTGADHMALSSQNLHTGHTTPFQLFFFFAPIVSRSKIETQTEDNPDLSEVMIIWI